MEKAKKELESKLDELLGEFIVKHYIRELRLELHSKEFRPTGLNVFTHTEIHVLSKFKWPLEVPK